jgi:hypothetical protein
MTTSKVHLEADIFEDFVLPQLTTTLIKQIQSRAAGIDDPDEVVPSFVESAADGSLVAVAKINLIALRLRKNGHIVGLVDRHSSITWFDEEVFPFRLEGLPVTIEKGERYHLSLSVIEKATEPDKLSLVVTLPPRSFEHVVFATNLKAEGDEDKSQNFLHSDSNAAFSSSLEIRVNFVFAYEHGLSGEVSEILVGQDHGVMSLQFDD